MSEKNWSPSEEVKEEHRDVWDFSKIEAEFGEEKEQVFQMLKNFEGMAFDENGLLNKEGKDPVYIEVFVKILATSLEAFEGFEEEIAKEDRNLKERKRSEIEEALKKPGNHKKQKTEKGIELDFPGLIKSTEREKIEGAIVSLKSLIRSYLFIYVEMGVLTEQQILDFGFGEKIVEEIKKEIQDKREQNFDEWKKTHLNHHPEFQELFALMHTGEDDLGKTTNDIETLTKYSEELKKQIIETKDKNQTESREIKDFFEENYWKPSEERFQRLTTLLSELTEQQAKDTLLMGFNENTQDVRDLVDGIPRVGVHELKNHFEADKYFDLAQILKDKRKELVESWENLEQQRVIVKRTDGSATSVQINQEIDRLTNRRKESMDFLNEMIRSAETPPVDLMSSEELVDECQRQGWDPFIWFEQKFQQEGRMKDVVQAFKGVAFGVIKPELGAGPDEILEAREKELERKVQKVRLQLSTLDDKGIHETGKASTHRGILEEEMGNRQIARHEVMQATTYHPEWGEDVREILEFITKVPALSPGEKLVKRMVRRRDNSTHEELAIVRFETDQNGQETEVVGDRLPGDEDAELFKYVPGFEYHNLAGDKGRDLLTSKIDEFFPDVHPMAKYFADKLFTSMDMLTATIAQKQLKTQTRAHNGGIGGTDFALLYNPLASIVHRMERYGGADTDWTTWWLYLLENVEEEDLRFGKRVPRDANGVSEDPNKTSDASYVSHNQHLAKLHQRAYFQDGQNERRIRHLGFGESYFPHTQKMLFLGDGDTLEVDGKVIDKDFVEVEEGKEEYASDFGLYFIAENGWKTMLELSFQEIPEDLTFETVLEELEHGSGGKGGVLSKFLGSGAGGAKMFPGDHLKECLAPMLIHLVRRIFQHYSGRGEKAEMRLYRGVVKAIEDSKSSTSGLGRYEEQLDYVLDVLSGSRYRHMSDTLKKRDLGHRSAATKEYAQAWFRHEFNEEPPKDIAGYALNLGQDPNVTEYLEILRDDPDVKIPRPFVRSGSMVQVTDHEK